MAMFDQHSFDRRPATLALALLLTWSCNGTTIDDQPQAPSWLAGLSERAIEATPGETVWAVVPELGNEGARVGTYRLESATGGEAVLVDGIGNRYAGVPGALVHPVSGFPEAELAVGTVVLADRWDAGQVVGRVLGVQAGLVELAYDWNGVTVSGTMASFMALPVAEDSLALRWVGYQVPGDDSWYKGLCFAENDAQAWISTDDNRVEVISRDAVKPLTDLGRAVFATGDAVAAYSWDHGYRPGVVAEVLEPGLRYAVKLEGGEMRPVFFDSLTASPL